MLTVPLLVREEVPCGLEEFGIAFFLACFILQLSVSWHNHILFDWHNIVLPVAFLAVTLVFDKKAKVTAFVVLVGCYTAAIWSYATWRT